MQLFRASILSIWDQGWLSFSKYRLSMRLLNWTQQQIFCAPNKVSQIIVWKCNARYVELNLTFICPWVADIFPNYNQEDATFLDLFISTDALHVSGGSFAHHTQWLQMAKSWPPVTNSKCISKLKPKRCNVSWFIYFYRCITCFRRFLRPSSGAQDCTYSFRYCYSMLLLSVIVDEMELIVPPHPH